MSTNMYGGGMDPMGGTGFGALSESGNKSAEKKGSRERQSLIPVTAKQILTCENVDDVFRLDGAELFTVKIIGTVDSVAEHATNHTYQISDSTGSIECKLWIDKDSGGSVAMSANTLVRICGSLREYEGRRHVLVYDMSRVDDWNELTHHMLEVVYVHLLHTRGPIQSSGRPLAASSPGGFAMAPSFSARAAATSASVSGSKSSLQDALCDVIRSDQSEPGMNSQDAFKRLSPKFSGLTLRDIQGAISELCNSGVLYSTVDDDHFKTTDS